MEEFFEDMIERAHYYEQFELLREYKQIFQRNQTRKYRFRRKELFIGKSEKQFKNQIKNIQI
jgi:hypothetical protein